MLATYDPDTKGGSAPDGRKVKSTMHWVSAAHAVPATVALYERLFTTEVPGESTGDPLDDVDPDSREMLTGCRVEAALADTPPGEVVQFERLGYFAHDPREPMLFHRTVGLRDEWANIQKRQGLTCRRPAGSSSSAARTARSSSPTMAGSPPCCGAGPLIG